MNALSLAARNDATMAYMPEVIIVPTIPAHITELCGTLRDMDRLEIEQYGMSGEDGLWLSYKAGLMNQTAIIDGEVAAVWGVAGEYLGDIGQPWLMTSSAIKKISPLRFAKYYQREVFKMLEFFDILENYVLAEYEGAVRLLSIIGFTIGEPEPFGTGMYRKFSMIKERA